MRSAARGSALPSPRSPSTMPTVVSCGKWWPLATICVPMTISASPDSIDLMISRISMSDGTRSEERSASRAAGKRARTSSAMRSTPGPQATSESRRAALGALGRRRQREAAVVAVEAVAVAVLHQPGRALRAVEAVAAGAAQREGRIAAAVEEQQRLPPSPSVSSMAVTSVGESQRPASGGALRMSMGMTSGSSAPE